MPRARNHALYSAVDGLVGAMNGLLATLGASGPKLPPEMKHAPGAKPGTPKTRGPGKGNARLKSALKRSWAAYTPAQRKERIRRMLAGRGLEPKGAITKKAAKSKGGAWASMTPEQRAERMAKMRTGRGL
jgi:hypothetical protein